MKTVIAFLISSLMISGCDMTLDTTETAQFSQDGISFRYPASWDVDYQNSDGQHQWISLEGVFSLGVDINIESRNQEIPRALYEDTINIMAYAQGYSDTFKQLEIPGASIESKRFEVIDDIKESELGNVQCVREFYQVKGYTREAFLRDYCGMQTPSHSIYFVMQRNQREETRLEPGIKLVMGSFAMRSDLSENAATQTVSL
ncbi:hypothetical protein [Zooshikella ganghwensis]|uniref:hypothetical protein n=1 Tax=Zooshikella ganghwensis TaxID=202772 RepID=UPI0012F97889|nr:hypothetical protein [Zooshikella ganghwensis]